VIQEPLDQQEQQEPLEIKVLKVPRVQLAQQDKKVKLE
jgi:hypothetical protein